MRVFQSIYEHRGARGWWLPICAALALAPIAALAQPAPSHHSHTANTSTGPDNGAVISIRYHCAPESSEAGACAMAVTKQEFDALVRAIDPNMPASGRQALAAEYSRLLIMAAEARRRGLDQLPELQTLLKFSELQLLGARLVRDISGRASLVTPEEIEAYFRDHGRDYQEVTLSRIFVPVHPGGQSQHGSSAAEQAEQAHTRAINGENFSTLQREIKEASPNVSLGPMPCRSLPEAHRQVCDLTVGEISNTFSDKSGYSIYRLEAKRQRELDDVRDEIRATLERQRVQEEIQKVRNPASMELNESYFGKLPPPDLAGQHGMHFPHARTTVPSDQTQAHQH